MSISDKYLTEKELAELFGISVSKLQNDRLMGRGIPYVKVGRAVRYASSAVEAWLAEHRHGDRIQAGKVA